MPVLAIPFPIIDPVAIAIGPVALRWYGLAYVAGLLGGWLYARWLVGRDGLWGGLKRPTTPQLDDLLVWVAVGVVLGGRLGYVLFYDLASYVDEPLEILAIWRGGMSFHGGLIGATLALALFGRRYGYNPLSIFDLAAAVVPIGLFFGRIANFINGELWGRVAPDFAYAMVFPNGGPLPRHPSQIYQAFLEGPVLFILLAFVVSRVGFRQPGLVAGVFGIGYGLVRIVAEFFREPDPQLGYLFGQSVGALGGGVTMGMVLSLPMLLIGGWLVMRARAAARQTV
ncbi:MAG: prolipoprotein diacylglyceryl transferase [Beijerinckiaceae bacterium]|jgi:phosphatidylglycerol:prolipoprotein diacylglycerol transferase|nr:prolipoprotein diacylglyceryl transferase [Beijerinckiaceae bacterium]